jgi:hypothetical protein
MACGPGTPETGACRRPAHGKRPRRYARRVPRLYLGSSRQRATALCLSALLALALAGAHPPAAMSASNLSGSGSLSELTEGAQATTPTQTTATTATTATEATTNSKTVIVLAIAAAFVLLIAIAFVIIRDARKVAPVTEGQLSEGGSSRDSAARL